MNLCAKGCGREAKVRRMCRICYNVRRIKWQKAGLWEGPIDSIGTTRRLRALVALGYNQQHLAQATGLGYSTISYLILGKVTRTGRARAAKVRAVYDRLSMTPGPSRAARDRAHRSGWMPPLAWDDDTIDDPAAQPNPGHQERIGFRERFFEERELGYSDLLIAQRWKMRPESLLRQLNRHDITPDPALVNEVTTTKRRLKAEQAS